jgi:hypothetical protein
LALLQVVIDDSGRGQERDPAFVLAGYVARVRNWEAFAGAWHRALSEKPAIDFLKGSEAFRLAGQFRGWSEKKRDTKVIKLISLIHQYCPLSITLAVNGKAFDAILKATKGSLRNVYALAVAGLTSKVLSYSAHQQTFEKLEFVFDKGILSREKDFEDAFNDMMISLPPRATNLIGKRPHMEDDLKFLPLQAADLLASYLRQKIAAEARGEVFQNEVYEALANGPANLDASLSTDALLDLRRRFEARNVHWD